ncbi:MarC family protein [Silvibacterium dinghuense]|uniref:MarC family protein n=1 Tax=Silvibacterium dinghuense TaxID=1560006 RepID=UPI0019574333|nr:MarC family protein [Silvibacterium dinghuense]
MDITFLLKETVLVVAALFPIVNPLGSAAIFSGLVGEVDERIQAILARKIAIYSVVLLVASMLWGVEVLSFFGISIYAVQIGGGLIVTVAGWSLLNQDARKARTDGDDGSNLIDHAFYPFTLPITVGPGSISVAITLGAHLMAERGGLAFLSPRVLIPGIAGALLVCLVIYICYRYARRAERLLGKTGTIVVMRLSSFILVCIGIQIVATGVRSYLETIGSHR